MQNQFGDKNGQATNIFQDAKGFYQRMGKGNTRYKFCFGLDVQMQMDAGLKDNAKQKAQQIYQQQS